MDQNQSVTPWNTIDQSFDDQQFEETKQVQIYQNQQFDEKKTIDKQPTLNKSPKKSQKIKINTSQARGELKLLRKLIRKNGWKEELQYGEGNILWMGLAPRIDELSAMLQFKVNRFPAMNELAHKTQTSLFLNKFREYWPEQFDFFPRSFIIPEQYDEFEKVFRCKKKGKFYISKPDSGSQGDGIIIINQIKDLYANKAQVVQEYIKKPLLIDNKKFDLRLYVLVTSLDPYICYLNKEGLARFCTVDYEPINVQNLRNPYMHLTNYSLNKESPQFIHNTENLLEINQGTKRTLTSIKKNIAQVKNVEDIMEQIEELIVKFMISMRPFLHYNLRTAFQAKTQQAKCFHILGFDILLDSKGKPWLLEVNANPSLNIEHEVLGKDGKPNYEPSPLDEYVKEQVVEDAILLVMKSPQKQLEEIQIGQCFNSYKMLIGGDISEISEITDVVDQILKVYGWVSGYKFSESITSSKFTKLGSLPRMTNSKFIKHDYDLLYRKIMCKEQKNYMDFFSFITAIENISEKVICLINKFKKLIPTYDPQNKLSSVTELVIQIVSNF